MRVASFVREGREDGDGDGRVPLCCCMGLVDWWVRSNRIYCFLIVLLVWILDFGLDWEGRLGLGSLFVGVLEGIFFSSLRWKTYVWCGDWEYGFLVMCSGLLGALLGCLVSWRIREVLCYFVHGELEMLLLLLCVLLTLCNCCFYSQFGIG